jgi:hypothetical protein
VAEQVKAGIVQPLGQVAAAAGLETIHADHLVGVVCHELINEMGADKSSSACYQVTHKKYVVAEPER